MEAVVAVAGDWLCNLGAACLLRMQLLHGAQEAPQAAETCTQSRWRTGQCQVGLPPPSTFLLW